MVELAYLLWNWAERRLRAKYPEMPFEESVHTLGEVARIRCGARKSPQDSAANTTMEQADLLRARGVMDYLPVPQTLRTSALECVGQESGRATPSTRLGEGRCSLRYSLHSKDATSRRSAPSVARGWGCTLLTEPDGNSAEGASYRRSWVRKGKLATASPPPRP